jgi:hypothetical protein
MTPLRACTRLSITICSWHKNENWTKSNTALLKTVGLCHCDAIPHPDIVLSLQACLAFDFCFMGSDCLLDTILCEQDMLPQSYQRCKSHPMLANRKILSKRSTIWKDESYPFCVSAAWKRLTCSLPSRRSAKSREHVKKNIMQFERIQCSWNQ